MKSILKFTLLASLIVTGKFVKQPTQVAATQVAATNKAADNNTVVLVHQVLTSEPVKPSEEHEKPQQTGNGLLAELF